MNNNRALASSARQGPYPDQSRNTWYPQSTSHDHNQSPTPPVPHSLLPTSQVPPLVCLFPMGNKHTINPIVSYRILYYPTASPHALVACAATAG